MKKYFLSRESFNVMKQIDMRQYDDSNVHISFDEDNTSISVDNIRELLIVLNEELCVNGLTDHQETVTEYGYKIYALYDELLAQR